jgi:hypothetical protein
LRRASCSIGILLDDRSDVKGKDLVFYLISEMAVEVRVESVWAIIGW